MALVRSREVVPGVPVVPEPSGGWQSDRAGRELVFAVFRISGCPLLGMVVSLRRPELVMNLTLMDSQN
jgi:hypothetical protein